MSETNKLAEENKGKKEIKQLEEVKPSFFKETKYELSKVTWPSKKELFKKTGIVLGVVIFSAVFVWLIDTMWSAGLGLLLK